MTGFVFWEGGRASMRPLCWVSHSWLPELEPDEMNCCCEAKQPHQNVRPHKPWSDKKSILISHITGLNITIHHRIRVKKIKELRPLTSLYILQPELLLLPKYVLFPGAAIRSIKKTLIRTKTCIWKGAAVKNLGCQIRRFRSNCTIWQHNIRRAHNSTSVDLTTS